MKICKFNALYGDSWGYKCSNNVEKKITCKRGNVFHTKNSHEILRLIHNFTCLKRFPYNRPQKVKYIKNSGCRDQESQCLSLNKTTRFHYTDWEGCLKDIQNHVK